MPFQINFQQSTRCASEISSAALSNVSTSFSSVSDGAAIVGGYSTSIIMSNNGSSGSGNSGSFNLFGGNLPRDSSLGLDIEDRRQSEGSMGMFPLDEK